MDDEKEGLPMTKITMATMYEIMVILYAIGIVFYFIDYLYKYVKARRIAFWFVCIAWTWQTIFFVLFIIESKRFPILSLFEGIYFYAWLLTTLSIVLHCIARVDMPVFFVNVLSFVFVTIHLFAPAEKVQPMVRFTRVGNARYPYFICYYVLCGIFVIVRIFDIVLNFISHFKTKKDKRTLVSLTFITANEQLDEQFYASRGTVAFY